MTIAVNYRAFPRSLDRESPDARQGQSLLATCRFRPSISEGSGQSKIRMQAIAGTIQSQRRSPKSAPLPREILVHCSRNRPAHGAYTSTSPQRHDLHFTATPQNIHAHRLRVAFERKVDTCVSDSQITNADMLQLFRKCRVMKIDPRLLRPNLQSQTRLQNHECRTCRPCLRRTSNRIKRRALSGSPSKPADQFRKSIERDFSRQVEQSRQHTKRKILVCTSQRAKGDQRVIVRPYRAVVIRHRVIASLARYQSPDTPSGIKRRRQESPASLTERYCASVAIPEKETLPRVGARTPHCRFSPSSAKANIESSSDQNIAWNCERNCAACACSLSAKSE